MNVEAALRVLIACIAFGAAGEAFRRYRAFKSARRSLPPQQRNAGFWTDGRLIRAEAAFFTIAFAIPFTAIAMLVGTNGSVYASFAVLLAYAGMIWLVVSGLNKPLP